MHSNSDGKSAFFFAGFVVACFVLLTAIGYCTAFPALKEWQTLIAGALALLAAYGSVNAIHNQIQQSDRVEAQRVKRLNFAARAGLSQPLSGQIDRQRKIISQFYSFLDEIPHKERYEGTFRVPAQNQDDVNRLIDCIVSADDLPAHDLSELISDLQVQTARLFALKNSREDRSNIRYYAVDAVLIYARASRLLDYARRQDSEYFANDLPSVLAGSCNIMINQLEVRDLIDKRIAKKVDSWLFPRDG